MPTTDYIWEVTTPDSNLHKLKDAESMHYRGTLGTGGDITVLPTASASNKGDTYKVITDGTYAGQEAKAGDLFISDGSSWILISGSGSSVDTWRNIKVNGTEKLGTATNTGAVDFVNGTNTSVSFDSSGNKIKIDAVDTTYEEATTSTAGLMSASDKTKLNGIATGAEVNVQSDWNQTATTADDYIKNKPTIPPAVAVKGDSETAYRTGNVNITKGNIGLGNVDNTSDVTKKTNFTGSIASGNTGFVTGGDVYTALNGKLNTSLKGAANGLAELDADGKVPSSQLPSYVDDVIEVADYAHLPITGESGKIYVTLDTNLTYRWTGTGYTEISASLALGETSSTAYRGDRGKTAYDHATESGKISAAVSSGLYKIAATAQGHIASLTAVQKSDITALGIPGSDTNTHRPIQVNGTQNLGDNTTPLNLKNGTNITVTADGGNVTIATSAEVNQNAFSNVKVGSTTVAADSKTDTLELVAGSNVTITPDATNDKITIAATDTNTTYTLATGDSNGQIKVTPSSGSAYNVAVKGLGSNAYSSTAYLPLSGGTMTGSLTFANGTKNVVGDDCAMGDFNVGGTLALQGQNAATSVAFIKQGETWGSGANYGKVTYDGTNFVLTKNIIVQKSNPAITLDNTNTLSAGADSPALSLKLKTADGSAAYTTNVISFIGTNTGDGNNIPVRFGSSSGTTIISAGEAGVQFAAKNSKFNDENLYLVSDSSILLYKDTANDGTISTGPLEAAGFTGTITSGRVVVSSGTRGGLSASAYTIEKSVPSNAVFTDTHRPIQMNGTEILGNNTTALNLKAGSNVSLTNSSGTVTIAATDTNTTYTFANGTNGFTVTPSGGTAQTVTVTPSIANNITGSGTSGYIAKFNGTNTITNGPAFGTATTTYLRNDGSWATPTDTNTHRPIQMNGTEILGNNTTALNLKAGSNVSLTNSSGTVTIAATDTKYTAATAAPGNIATSGAVGTSTNYARQDHTHGISLATGDANGQVKIAGTNVSVKGLGSNAYSSTAYLPLAGGTMTGPLKFRDQTIPQFSGNPPYLLGIESFASGGDVKWQRVDSVNVGRATLSDMLIEADYTNNNYVRHTDNYRLKASLTRQNKCGINSSSSAGGLLIAGSWSASSYNAELYIGMGDNLNIFYRGVNASNYTDWYPLGRFTQTAPTSGQVVITDGTGGGIKASGYTIAKSVPSNAVFTDTHRPIQVNGTEILGNNTTALNLKAGSNVSLTNSSGTVTIAATDTKYTAATAAPGNIASSGAVGTSTNYARQDHTHGITLATGDNNGQVKIAGTNVSVKGLGSNAYTSTAYLPLAGGTMTGGITFNKVNNAIVYTGTKATYNMVKFIDNTGDEYGNGISIGGGGLTIIGGGESADAIASGKSGGEEMLYLANDQSVQIITGVQNGLSSAKTFEFKTDGTATFDGKWVGRFTANPTSGQVVITDGTTGGMKSSGYTIAKSVPSNAIFTDTTYTIATGDSNGQIKVSPSSGSAYNVGVKGLNTMAYENKDDYRKRYLASFSGNGDSAGYCKVCTITITSGYINGPIEIALQERGRSTVNRLYILFASVNNSDPSLSSFKVLGTYTGYYIYKVATSKWEVYATKNEAWSGIWVIDCSLYSIASPGMTIAWNMENASLPSSGTTQATHIYATSDTNTHRPIQMNGTEILGNNTTALNLKAGSNVSLTNSSGTVTIAATNTLNTAGSTDTSSKIFLIGATSQAANPQTYSDNEVYATSGVLTTKSVQVGGTAATMQYNSTNHCIDFVVT